SGLPDAGRRAGPVPPLETLGSLRRWWISSCHHALLHHQPQRHLHRAFPVLSHTHRFSWIVLPVAPGTECVPGSWVSLLCCSAGRAREPCGLSLGFFLLLCKLCGTVTPDNALGS